MVAVFFSGAGKGGQVAGHPGAGARQVLVELDTVNLFMIATGAYASPGISIEVATSVDSVLGVWAASDADPGMVTTAMQHLAAGVTTHLANKLRGASVGPGGGR
jgi:hypothetical protein